MNQQLRCYLYMVYIFTFADGDVGIFYMMF